MNDPFEEAVGEFNSRLEGLKSSVDRIRSTFHLATKEDLQEIKGSIMAALDDLKKFAQDQKTFNERQAAAVDSLVESVSGLSGDFATLNDKITELQNSAGNVETPQEVKDLIAEVKAQSEAITSKSEAAAQAAKSLDEQTPPRVPPTPPNA